MVLPDFIIIGAARCGTTSLYNYMTNHPNIFPASEKELHFFDLNYNKGVSWYKSKFFQDNNKEKNFTRPANNTPFNIIKKKVDK